MALESAYLSRADVFDRPAADAVVEAEEPSEPVAEPERYVQLGAEAPEDAGPVVAAF